MNDYALKLENITKKYKDGTKENTVLDNISLSVKYGEFVAIVGPSGSGKSTLLSITGALLSPSSGNVTIGSTNISNKNQREWTLVRKKQIGFIFQSHKLLPFLTVKDQLKLVKDMNKDTQTEDIDELLLDLGLKDLALKYPHTLSLGEKQRVAIGRAFVNNPDIILADEPTASLDGVRGRQITQMIQKEVKKKNKAAIMVTHDDRILDLVDTIYKLKDNHLEIFKK